MVGASSATATFDCGLDLGAGRLYAAVSSFRIWGADPEWKFGSIPIHEYAFQSNDEWSGEVAESAKKKTSSVDLFISKTGPFRGHLLLASSAFFWLKEVTPWRAG